MWKTSKIRTVKYVFMCAYPLEKNDKIKVKNMRFRPVFEIFGVLEKYLLEQRSMEVGNAENGGVVEKRGVEGVCSEKGMCQG